VVGWVFACCAGSGCQSWADGNGTCGGSDAEKGICDGSVLNEPGFCMVLDILTLMGVPQRGQLLRLGESGNSH
jgi:hypothetical protein